MEVGVWADDKGVILTVVAPEVAQGPGHRQEGDLVHRSAPPHWPGVTQLGPVPHHPGHPGLADHFTPSGLYPGKLDLALGLVVPGQHLGVPVLRIIVVLRAEDEISTFQFLSSRIQFMLRSRQEFKKASLLIFSSTSLALMVSRGVNLSR